MNEEIAKEKYEEAQAVYEQLQKIEEKINEINEKSNSADETIKIIENYSESTKEDIFFPVSTGIFTKKDADYFLVNVGSNIFVKKKKNEVIEMINLQKENIKKVSIQFQEAYARLQERMLQIQNEISKEQ